jgi:hypothetical protein
MDWMRTFGKYNAGNINTQDVLKVCAYSSILMWNYCHLGYGALSGFEV